MKRTWLALAVMSVLAGPLFAEAPATVRHVRVVGLQHVKERRALAEVKARAGVALDSDALARDVRALYSLGDFDDVTLDVQPAEGGVDVIFRVVERPRIAKIRVRGNKALSTHKLEEAATLKEDEPLDPSRIRPSLDAMQALYRGEGFTGSDVHLSSSTDAKGRALVTFEVQEGRRAKVDQVVISGASAFPDRRLQRQLRQRKNKVFFADKLSEDASSLARFYKDRGYRDVAISSPTVTPSRDGARVRLRYEVTEGPIVAFGTATFRGAHVFSTADLSRRLRWQPGDRYRERDLEQTLSALHDLYGEKGYLRVQIVPTLGPLDARGQSSVTFDLSEGDVVYVDRIAVEGASSTKPFVLRREILLKEGQPFSSVAARRSVERLYNLGFLDRVDIDLEQPSSPQKADVTFTVQEGQPGMLSAGLGYSSADRFGGQFQVTHNNFLGRAQQVHAIGTISARGNSVDVGWREPWLAGKPLSLAINAFDARHDRTYLRDRSAYRTRDTGFSLGLGPRLSDSDSLLFTYRFDRQRRYNLPEDRMDIRQDVLGDATRRERTFLYSDVTAEFHHDTRDNAFDATRGTHLRVAWTQGGLVPADAVRYYRPEVEAVRYWPLFWRAVLSVRGQWSLLNVYGSTERHDIADQLFRLGGIDSVRGYRDGSIGEATGGQLMNVYSAELKFPLVPPDPNGRSILQGVLFYDIGGAWAHPSDWRYRTGTNDADLRQGVGFGLRIKTPVFPIRLEWGLPLNRGAHEDRIQTHISVGTTF